MLGQVQWLIGEGLAPSCYVASQGTAMGRAGAGVYRTDWRGYLGRWFGRDLYFGATAFVRLKRLLLLTARFGLALPVVALRFFFQAGATPAGWPGR